jgi:mannose-1-phosphate guanylyltransferase
MIVTTEVLSEAIAEQAEGVRVLAEPRGRNTAPCVYWAAQEVYAQDPDAVMMVMPSDHYMAHPDRYIETVKMAARWAAEKSDLVTLGIRPTRPETGYGYLRTGKSLSSGCSQVAAFVEKPNLSKAQEFLKAGNYLWNGGMFLWRARTILAVKAANDAKCTMLPAARAARIAKSLSVHPAADQYFAATVLNVKMAVVVPPVLAATALANQILKIKKCSRRLVVNAELPAKFLFVHFQANRFFVTTALTKAA